MFKNLEIINSRPAPFEFYTAETLWNDEYISKKMLEFHLDEKGDLASRNKAFINKTVEWISKRFNIGAGTKICDFGCGPGLYSTQFAEKGAEVTGVDFSENSIKYAANTAERKNLEIDYILQNYLQFSTDKKFDLLTMIYLDFCPLNPEQRKTLLAKFRELLGNDGAILLDVLSVNYFNKIEEKRTYEYCPENGFWSSEPYYMFLNTFKYYEENLILDKHTIIEKTRTREIYNWLQCFGLQSLKKEFQENGLRIIEHYSDVAGKPYSPDSMEMAIVAKKL